jgi:hypothetical protein
MLMRRAHASQALLVLIIIVEKDYKESAGN